MFAALTHQADEAPARAVHDALVVMPERARDAAAVRSASSQHPESAQNTRDRHTAQTDTRHSKHRTDTHTQAKDKTDRHSVQDQERRVRLMDKVAYSCSRDLNREQVQQIDGQNDRGSFAFSRQEVRQVLHRKGEGFRAR